MSANSNEVELALLRADVDIMKDDVKALRKEIADLIDAWKTANNVLSFVKWVSGMGIAVVAFWTLIKAKLGG